MWGSEGEGRKGGRGDGQEGQAANMKTLVSEW